MSKAVNLTGQRFGRLMAVRQFGKQGRQWLWECHCDCGGAANVLPGNLKTGKQKSCGCLRVDKAKSFSRERVLNDLSGRSFGRYLVLELSEKRLDRNRMWRCRCKCGNERDVFARSLLSGVSNSCGCLMKELSAQRFITHGKSATPEYRAEAEGRRRAQRWAVPFERFDASEVFDKAGWHCYICNRDTPRELRGKRKPNSPELDHIIPLSRGGSHTRDNAACICYRCNRMKGPKPLHLIKAQLAGLGGA